MDDEERKKLINRLRRAEGQIHGIIEMLESKESCVPLLMQIAAVRGGLNQVSQRLISDHIKHCLVEVFKNGDEEAQSRKIADLIHIFTVYLGSKS